MKKKIFWIIAVLVVIILVAIGLKSAGVIGKDEGIKVATEKVGDPYHHRNSERQTAKCILK